MVMLLDSMPQPRTKDPASVLEYFAALPDPRRDHGKVHMLDEIVFMSRLARTLGKMGNLGRFALWAGFVYSSLCDSNYGTARRANNGTHSAYLFGRGHPAF